MSSEFTGGLSEVPALLLKFAISAGGQLIISRLLDEGGVTKETVLASLPLTDRPDPKPPPPK